ncbi:MAG: ATP synthase subunit I [Clostridia bacterium]|nr:ATP synthase subunit I [Clostridia bacterium]
MKRLDPVIKRETLYIGAWVLILSAIMQAVFLIIGKWDYTVLLGNLLTGSASVLNFFLMALTVQRAVDKDEKDARGTMKASQALRNLMMFVIVVLGVLLPCFNIWASIIPVFFPRISMLFRAMLNKK